MSPNQELLTNNQKLLLVQVFNRLIPSEGNLPAAGTLGLHINLEADISRSSSTIRMFLEGLVQIQVIAMREKGQEFPELSESDKDAVISNIEQSNPVFFADLRRHCYNSYYTHPTVQELIGYHRSEPNQYQPKPFDESLLEPQKNRPPFWRHV